MSTASCLGKKLILVIGATGAQGLAVIDSLLAPGEDGSPSPYAIPNLGAFDDFPSMYSAFRGVYGAFVNTDGFTVGEEKETWVGLRLFEIAKEVKTVRHYVYSGLDYALKKPYHCKKGNYDAKYHFGHTDGKARVAEFMRSQPSIASDSDMSWSVVTTTPYMDMLLTHMFGPWKKREDGTFVFATPIGNGQVPMIALSDIGFFARYTFDNREATSAQELEITSDMVGWEYLVETFRKVTGQKAEVKYLSYDEWCRYLNNVDHPVANEKTVGDGSTSWRENFRAWWTVWRDGIFKRDMDWIRKVNPHTHSLEAWMREKGYTGELTALMKNAEDGKSARLNSSRVAQL
ncbi:hypothetical protein CERSUDRAFT_100239 [Gelatoporia subvermispora B]|uniref:NmrA-like domain-containing protein n=1 Tax=Ceriporiopsis subvermispora (strain B) TaxID=914234 RepID=M2QYF8_CERS8|nr:hypothetical protein CERSUDRAFT_100239 [Gelatoporia subvermispora B]